VSIFGILITIFISASVVPTEVENRVIYTVLSKPIRRFQYLMGKFVGVQMIVLLNLILMGGLFGVALFFKEKTVPTLLFWNILLTYFMFLIVSAFTFAISCASSSSVLPTIAGLFIYITGNLTEYLKDVIVRASEQGSEWLGYVADALYRVLPNLQSFSLKEQILYYEINDPPRDLQLSMLIVYGILYALAGFILAYWVFRRREL
jgi:ABC-type transport system involved in multi-copper enzyme maturation permease subunit